QAQFNSDALAFCGAVQQKEPYATFWNYINVHTVFRASAQSGANQPDVVPPIVVNNAYGATYNTGGTARCLYIQNTALAAADAALAPANEGRVMVIVNDPRYGGCAGEFAVSYNGPSMTEVEIHEIGHSLGLLADEYDYPYQTWTGGEPGEPNITASPTGQKWSQWLGSNGISAFQGAGYYLYGLFRPKLDCLMRDLGQPLCAVCVEQLTRILNGIVNCIDTATPATPTVVIQIGAQQTFSITSIVPPQNNPVISWKVDSVLQAGQTGLSFVLATAGMGVGGHSVAVSVQDQSPFVRVDPNHTMLDTHTWNAIVSDPTLAELRVPSITTSLIWLAPGQEVDVTTTVVNDGPNATGPFTVEHFLSTDSTWSLTDSFVGGYTVPGLAIGQQDVTTRRFRVPTLTAAQVQFLFAVVDRGNQVHEVNEGNNINHTAMIVQNPPCTPALEFRDDLLYPKDAAAVSIINGGTCLPTVIARCATPGSQYLIVWGCSGTSPGTTIGNLTVPLNQDLFTMIGLQSTNGALFQQFWGSLDAQGVGRATFQWPAGFNMQPLPGNFAAILLDATPQFVGVTNPVAIDIR
ncbi:MAG TPA: M64 family metallopeptidase, partial [Planctomycetota bacterium]|nr:M64 family metallopeptidase [Planctomycetota bacterium]